MKQTTESLIEINLICTFLAGIKSLVITKERPFSKTFEKNLNNKF